MMHPIQPDSHSAFTSILESLDLDSDELADLDYANLLGSAPGNGEAPTFHDDFDAFRTKESESAPAKQTTASRPYETSLKVFRRHLVSVTHPDGTTHVEADGIISRACYEDWLSTRPRATTEPEKTFQRILTCCVSGTDGRQPFTPEEEIAVLEQLRVKRVWPAFVDTPLSIGIKGFRSLSFFVLQSGNRTLTRATLDTVDTGTTKRPGCRFRAT